MQNKAQITLENIANMPVEYWYALGIIALVAMVAWFLLATRSSNDDIPVKQAFRKNGASPLGGRKGKGLPADDITPWNGTDGNFGEGQPKPKSSSFTRID
ncbi:MAG: hypothetical protein ACEQSA_00075 [Weeksellaceae bacterium]